MRKRASIKLRPRVTRSDVGLSGIKNEVLPGPARQRSLRSIFRADFIAPSIAALWVSLTSSMA